MRLDKILANKGYGSRKEVKKIILSKQVYVNDILVSNVDIKIKENDVIRVLDTSFIYSEFEYIMLFKPDGVISATFDTYHTTVVDLIENAPKDIFPIGRLDIDTEGLCLLSNDGKLAHRLLSPKHHVSKVYHVFTQEDLSEEAIKTIKEGFYIKDEYFKPGLIKKIDNYYELTIYEGKFHHIKRMMEHFNNKVTYLKRVKMGPIWLDPSLKIGEYRYLSEKEIDLLRSI